ncbi:MAG: hypothetical protein GF350_10605 [Chitinivibrionales bacterium]|nr:hypothetical protein [Chitinivibrionales bacterium]
MISNHSIPNFSNAIRSFFFETGFKEFVVRGGSMSPLIEHGQKVTCIPCSSPLTKGRCYVYVADGVLVVHRLVDMNDTNAEFIGDNTCRRHTILLEQIIGEPAIRENRFRRLIIHLINYIFIKVAGTVPKAGAIRSCLVKATDAILPLGECYGKSKITL